MALSAVSGVKATTLPDMQPEQRKEFSMAAIKKMQHNKLIANRIFVNLGLELNNKKFRIYEQCIHTRIVAA